MNVKKFFIVLLIVLLGVSAATCGVYVAWRTSKPFELGEHGDALREIGEDGIANFLIVGKDHVGENTDVIMVASLNTKANTVNILSIPRDTCVRVGGADRKINSVYSYAGYKGLKKEETLINTVSEVSGLPIHYYAIINLKAFREIVDHLGGVEFDVKRDYDYDDPYQDLHIHLQKGVQVLDGEKAEGLIRYRHDYPMGDIDRVEVQQQFIAAMISQKLNLKYISKVSAVYASVTENVVGNMTIADIMSFAKQAMNNTSTQTHTLPGHTSATSPYWYQNDDETKTLIRDVFGYTAEN